METATTIVKRIAGIQEPVDFFAVLSENGEKDNCVLLESADVMKKYGEKSIGGCNPSLRITGKEDSFEITALNSLGEKMLKALKSDFGFCEKLKVLERNISGSVKKQERIVSEEERLKIPTLADVLRITAFKFKPTASKDNAINCGLFGVISYDFIDQFETLPKNNSSISTDPDFDMLFLDNLFIINHGEKTTSLIANYFPAIETETEGKQRCNAIIAGFEEKFNQASRENSTESRSVQKETLKVSSDTSKEEFINMVEKCKQHIIAGDVFQIVVSKTSIIEPVKRPLAIYKPLKEMNPSPYMFYFKTNDGILLGSSPETFIKVSNTEGSGKKLEIRPIAGTKTGLTLLKNTLT
ncbi:chorismate-binding protein [archaeon]|nr:chorismate-binding protein [archaeon]